MPPAARLGDPTAHGGTVGPPPPSVAARVATVLIGGKPAAVTGSQHICPMLPHAAMANANVLMPGMRPSGAVLIGGLPAACMGDRTSCGAVVVAGAPNVLIGGVA